MASHHLDGDTDYNEDLNSIFNFSVPFVANAKAHGSLVKQSAPKLLLGCRRRRGLLRRRFFLLRLFQSFLILLGMPVEVLEKQKGDQFLRTVSFVREDGVVSALGVLHTALDLL